MNRTKSSPVALVVVAMLLAGGCATAHSELEEQRQRWNESRPAAYAYSYTVTGFSAGGGPWRIEVRGEQVQTVAWEGSGSAPVVGPTVETAPTIDALFADIERQLSSDSVEVTVTYDANHIPAKAWFDSGEEGWGFVTKQFVPLTSPAQ